jgi:hypothetical protein
VGCGESLLMQSIHLWKSMSEERDRRLADKRVRINLRKQQQAKRETGAKSSLHVGGLCQLRFDLRSAGGGRPLPIVTAGPVGYMPQ